MYRKGLSLVFVTSLMIGSMLASPELMAIDSNAQSGFRTGIQKTGGSSGNDVGTTIQNIIGILLFIAGVMAVLVIVIAGFRFVTSNGDSGATSKAKNTIIYALVGLVLAIMAYAIVNFVLSNI